MGDVLSKEEIEMLLSAVSQGKVPQGKKKGEMPYKKIAISYNFRRPALVLKEQTRVLEFLHEDFTRSCGVKLSGYLRTTVELEIIATEQLTYTEFIASLSEPTYIAVIDASPLSGQIILEINPSLVFSIVDRLLGGSGEGLQEFRELTSIEHTIMDKVVSLVLNALKEAYEHIVSLGELVIVVILKVNMGENSGIMNICYPVSTVKPILPRLNPQQWAYARENKAGEGNLEVLQKKLSDTKVEVTVELGRAEVSILDFLRLVPGDVIRLDQPVEKALVVRVQGFPKFYASPGRMGRRRAVQIVSFIKKED